MSVSHDNGPGPAAAARRWWRELSDLDLAVYGAIAATPTPTLDDAFRRLSHMADHSKLWMGAAAMLATAGGQAGRRAAGNGLASIAVTSGVVNLVLKPLAQRRRPDRLSQRVPMARHVPMPTTTSLPSGHAASASAFATGVSTAAPFAGIPLRGLAALVGYSRVHTGVHYPIDVVAGSIVGDALAPVAVAALDRLRGARGRR